MLNNKFSENEKLISVVIPVFNGEQTIAETLGSVLEQSHRQLEVVVVDDGSTDRTADIVRGFEDARITLHQVNFGNCAAGRNWGIQHSRGDFVSFIDADDLWSPDKLEKQLAALAETGASLVYSFTTHIDESGRFLHDGFRGEISGRVYPQLLMRFFLESGSNALLRREVIERVGLFDESYEICADYEFFLRVAQDFEFALVPEAQIFYRQRASALSASGAGLRRESHRIIRQAVQRSPELRAIRRRALAVIDNYCFSKCLKSRRDLPAVILCFRCLWTHARAGRIGWRLLEQRPRVAGFWLTELFAWLLLPHGTYMHRRQERRRRFQAESGPDIAPAKS